MKKIVNTFLILLILVLSSGCAEKQIIFKEKLVCFEQQVFPLEIKQTVDIYESDKTYLNAIFEDIEEVLTDYKDQVDANNKLCKKNDKNIGIENEKYIW